MGVGGFGKTRGAAIPGNGGERAAPDTNRDIGRRTTLATWLKKRLSVGRRKREPLSVRAWGRLWRVALRAVSHVLRFPPEACGPVPAREGSAPVLPHL